MPRTPWPLLILATALGGCAADPSQPDDTADGVSDSDPTADTDGARPIDTDDSDGLLALGCDDLGVPTVALAPDPAEALSHAIRGRFPDTAPVLASACGGSFSESVVTFTAPTAGLWELTTDGPATTSDTQLSLRTTCDDVTELRCDLGGSGRHGSRVTVDALAGETFELVVQAASEPARGWQLTARAVDRLGALGDACDETVSCEAGSTCVGTTTPTCTAYDTPAVTDHTITWISTGTARHVLTGTDADADVAQVWLVRALAEDGEIYGDDPGEVPIRLGRDTWTLDEDAGTWQVVLDVDPNLFAFFVSPIVALDLTVEDAAGNRPTALRATYPAKPERTDVTEGEACDVVGFPRRCDNTTVCVDVGAGGTCIAPTAPTLTSATLAEARDGQYQITVEGEDATRDARRIRATVDFTDGAQRTYNLYFNDEGTTWDGDTYTASRTASFDGNSTEPTAVSVVVTDNKNLSTEPQDLAWPPTPLSVLASGESCVPDSDTSMCEDGLVCGLTLLGDRTCQTPAPPELYDVTLRYNPVTTWWEAQLDGADPNGDLVGANFAFFTPTYRRLEGQLAGGFVPSPVGDDFFVTTAFLEDLDPTQYTFVRVELADSTLRSEPILLPLQAELATGDTCTPDNLGPVCSLQDGLACGASATCETAASPTLTSVVAHRLNNGDLRLDFEGTDPNADAVDIVTTMIVDGEERGLNPPFTQPDSPILGETTFSSSMRYGGWASQGETVQVRLAVRDFTDRISNEITVTVPPIVALGATCSGDDTIDRCEDGSSCDAGTCQQHTPVLTEVTTTFDNAGRDLVVAIHGTDADGVLDEASLSFSGTGAGRSESVTIGRSYGLAHNLTWAGPDFLLEVYFPGWGGPDDASLDTVEVTVVDDADLTSNAASGPIAPTRNLGEACATDGSDHCQAGLVCTDSACAVDTTDPCAGASVIEASTAGQAIANGLRVPLDMTQGSAVAASTCGSAWSKAQGNEHVVRFVPDRTATLTVQSVTPDNDQIGVHVTEGQCVDPGHLLGCAKYDSAFTVEATQGVPLFLLVDTYYAHTGDVQLELTWPAAP